MAPTSPSKFEGLSDLPVSGALQTVIQSLESGSDAHPAEIVQALRSIATRVEGLEGALGESSQALMLMNHLSARALQGLGGTPNVTPSGSGAREEEAPARSFLMKRGDADIHEAHQKALQQRPRTTSSSSVSGSLSTAAAPLTRAEMEKARQARLERLEAQQASKKRELVEAEEKSKARDALLQRSLCGAAKPMGRF